MPTDPGALDIAAGFFAVLLILYGALRGMARLTLRFIGLVAGWLLAVRYCESLAVRLGAEPVASSLGPDLLRVAAFGIIFLAVIIGATFATWLVTRFLGAVHLRGLDRLAGAGLGLLMAILLMCAATIPLLALAPPDGGPLVRGSLLAPYAVAGGDYLKAAAPEPLRSRFIEASHSLFDPDFLQTRDRD